MRDISGNTTIGEGIAIGQNIQINVDKRSYHRSSRGGGSGGRGGGGDTDPRALLGLGFMVIAGVAFASWQFARHAPVVYLTLALCAAASGIFLTAISTWRAYHDAPWEEVALPFGAAIGGALILVALMISRKAYPVELTSFALQASGWKGFFCGLAPTWREFAAMQMVAVGLVAAPATLLLCVYTAGTALADLAYEGPAFLRRLADSITTPRLLAVLIGGAMLALMAQSNTASEAWTAYVAPQLEPFFSTRATPFSFCSR